MLAVRQASVWVVTIDFELRKDWHILDVSSPCEDIDFVNKTTSQNKQFAYPVTLINKI